MKHKKRKNTKPQTYKLNGDQRDALLARNLELQRLNGNAAEPLPQTESAESAESIGLADIMARINELEKRVTNTQASEGAPSQELSQELSNALADQLATNDGASIIEGGVEALNPNENSSEAEQESQDADDFNIEIKSDWLASDPEINRSLKEAGLNAAQAQVVYDLAAQRMENVIGEIMQHFSMLNDQQKLEQEFGGSTAWQRLSERVNDWAKANLPQDVVDTMGSSYDGVKALIAMMQGKEPQSFGASPAGDNPSELARLRSLMRDKRYWQKKDPKVRDEVRAGFERLYQE